MTTLSQRLPGPKNAWIGKILRFVALGNICFLIILFLGTILIPFQKLGPNQGTRMDVSALRSTIRMYSIDNKIFPSTEQGLQALVSEPTSEPLPVRWKKMLDDVPLDIWANPYQYRYPGIHNPDSFDVFSWGPDGVESKDDIGNWSS